MRHTKYLYGEYNTEDEKKNVKNTHDLFNGEMLLYYIHLYGVLYYFSSRKQYLLGQSFLDTFCCVLFISLIFRYSFFYIYLKYIIQKENSLKSIIHLNFLNILPVGQVLSENFPLEVNFIPINFRDSLFLLFQCIHLP